MILLGLMPPRSRYYSLKPQGAETEFVESAASYLYRLSSAHNVRVTSFLKDMTSQDVKVWNLSALCRGVYAVKYTSLMEKGVGNLNIRDLTLHKYYSVINDINLLASTRRWCPKCLSECRLDGIIYEQLAWLLKLMPACSKHRIRLHTSCPVCQATDLKLSKDVRLGFCNFCGSWLGGLECNLEVIPDDPWINWIIDNLSDLISKISIGNPSFEMFKQNLQIIINNIPGDNLYRLLECAKSTVHYWLNGKGKPSLEALLKISYMSNIPVTDLIERKIIDPVIIKKVILPKARAQKTLNLNNDEVERVLSASIDSFTTNPISVNMIANKLKICVDNLKKKYPTETKELIRLYANYRTHRKNARLEKIEQYIIDRVYLLHAEGIYPSRRKVMGKLHSLRLQKIWRNVMIELGYMLKKDV